MSKLTYVEVEAFVFDIINHLFDEYGLHIDDYTRLVNQVWRTETVQELEKMLIWLQGNLLDCMRQDAYRWQK